MIAFVYVATAHQLMRDEEKSQQLLLSQFVQPIFISIVVRSNESSFVNHFGLQKSLQTLGDKAERKKRSSSSFLSVLVLYQCKRAVIRCLMGTLTETKGFFRFH